MPQEEVEDVAGENGCLGYSTKCVVEDLDQDKWWKTDGQHWSATSVSHHLTKFVYLKWHLKASFLF